MKEDSKESKLEYEEIEWTRHIGLIIVFIIIGFISVIAFTHNLNRDSDQFKSCMLTFFCFMIFCFVALMLSLFHGVSISY